MSRLSTVFITIYQIFVLKTFAYSLLEPRDDPIVASWGTARSDICAVLDGRAALVGNQIFFLGANYSYAGSSLDQGPQQQLFALNLNQSFPIDDRYLNSSLSSTIVPGGFDWQYSTGIFWYDNTSLYLYSGNGQSEPSNQMSSFNISTTSWNQITVAGGNFQPATDRGDVLYTSIPGSGLSFVAGGTENYTTGLLRFDSRNMSWVNESVPSRTELGSPATQRFGGRMPYVPVGDQGILVLMGGSDTSHRGTEYGTSNGSWPYDDSPLSSVDIYDIDSGNWFNVQTTGDIPMYNTSHDPYTNTSIGDFCYWVSSAPDRSSFQITIYGGWSLYYGRAYENIWVLSLPSFTWIQMNDTNNSDYDLGGYIGRYVQHCFKWKSDHGFVLGGNIKNGTEQVNTGSCIAGWSPLKLLNLTTFEWQDSYDPDMGGDYQVHPNITKVIGGGATGGATAAQPQGGWNDTRLQTIFQMRPADYQAPTNLFATPSASHHDHAGTIAGSVVGGLAIIAALIGLIVYLTRRRKRSLRSQQSGSGRQAELDALGQGIYEADMSGRPIGHAEIDGGEKVRELEGSMSHAPAELDSNGVRQKSDTR